MSFVGPRPERPEFVADLEDKLPYFAERHMVKPGITGWAQINMENDAAVEDAPEKMQYDLYYIKNRSFTLDLLTGTNGKGNFADTKVTISLKDYSAEAILEYLSNILKIHYEIHDTQILFKPDVSN